MNYDEAIDALSRLFVLLRGDADEALSFAAVLYHSCSEYAVKIGKVRAAVR